MSEIDVTEKELKEACFWWDTLADTSKILKYRTSLAMNSLGIKEEYREL
jgi:hypothetical protein